MDNFDPNSEPTEPRVVRVKNGFWRINTADGPLTRVERDQLIEYFHEIRFPYQVVEGEVSVPDTVSWDDIHGVLCHFYDGVAFVCPF